MRKNFILISSVLILCFIITFKVWAWKGDTHKLLSESSIYNLRLGYDDLLLRLNLEKGLLHECLTLNNDTRNILEWVQEGADREDEWGYIWPQGVMLRFNNHFHNPLKIWENAQLSDNLLVWNNLSLILWAQFGLAQSFYHEGDNSWSMIRALYYSALVDKSEKSRAESIARTFKGLGHQIHLIQDSAVPDHVRNHTHMNSIEDWAIDNKNDVIKMIQYSFLPPDVDLNTPAAEMGLLPIANLVDTNIYNGENPSSTYSQGLAEYSNANFFCWDTIFSREGDGWPAWPWHRFPYPRKSSTDLDLCLNGEKEPIEVSYEGVYTVKKHYVSKKQDGEMIDHFLIFSYLEREISGIEHLLTGKEKEILGFEFAIDDNCYKEYTGKLAPRAVSYSAALLNYFFRGEMEITIPDKGVWAFTKDASQGFDKIALKVRNKTPDEDMKDGKLTLVVRFRTSSSDPNQGEYPPKPDENQYFIVQDYPVEVSYIPRDIPLKLEFDLSANPIPVNASDINISLVFKGTIGQEKDIAVGLGFKDISEPTPIDFINSTDKVVLNNTTYDVSDPEAFAIADLNSNKKIECNLGEPNIYPVNLLPRYLSFNGTAASDHNYFYRFESGEVIPPGEHLRVFVLAEKDNKVKYSLALDTQRTNILTQCEVLYDSTVFEGDARKNYLQYDSTANNYGHVCTPMTEYEEEYRYLWRNYELTYYPFPTYYIDGAGTTTQGGSTWPLPVLKLTASISSGTILILTATKADDTPWKTSGNIYFKVGSPEPFGVDRYQDWIEVKPDVPAVTFVTFKHNLADPKYVGSYPKKFYVRFESDKGGYAWVGPIKVGEIQ